MGSDTGTEERSPKTRGRVRASGAESGGGRQKRSGAGGKESSAGAGNEAKAAKRDDVVEEPDWNQYRFDRFDSVGERNRKVEEFTQAFIRWRMDPSD